MIYNQFKSCQLLEHQASCRGSKLPHLVSITIDEPRMSVESAKARLRWEQSDPEVVEKECCLTAAGINDRSKDIPQYSIPTPKGGGGVG